jgi:hypothetical protein
MVLWSLQHLFSYVLLYNGVLWRYNEHNYAKEETSMSVRRKEKSAQFDVVIVGGGLTGVCAALASARHGAKTALVQDRPVLGGNASSEIRMHVCGASENMIKDDAEETGILLELQLDNKYRNDYHNFSIWDAVLLHKVNSQENLTLFLNTTMNDLDVEGEQVKAIRCYQTTTEIHWTISAKIFADCTGNGTLGYMAGAEYRIGSEGKAEYNEPDAPDVPNNIRMGNTLLFKSVDRGHPVEFKTPDWARKFTEEDLKNRSHGDVKPSWFFDAKKSENDVKKADTTGDDGKRPFTAFGLDYGYWWIELPGHKEDIIEEYEELRDQLVGCVYGVWDHMKNEGDHGAANYDLQWVGMLPGVRESRRLVGEYMLTENDILSNRWFEDAVAYGGWPVDNHAPRGLEDKDVPPAFIHHFPGFYTIPYRSYCSKSIKNLFIGGRVLGASKLAMASTRVMGTCAVGGQALGTAAAMCIEHDCLPIGICHHMEQLQQNLIKEDCFIPGVTNRDTKDLALMAKVTASSQEDDAPCANVQRGYTRNYEGENHCWKSKGLSAHGEKLTLTLQQPAKVNQVRLTFDTNLNRAVKITMSGKRQLQQQVGAPAELVKDYTVSLLRDGKVVAQKAITGNFQRLNVVDLPATECDQVEIHITATNGHPHAIVFETRIYAE